MAENQVRPAMDSGARTADGSSLSTVSSNGARPTIALARARLIDGDIAGARVMFERLAASQAINPELLLTEAMLLEAEGRFEDALDRLGRIVTPTAGATRAGAESHGRIARLATQLGRPEAAEASGTAALALDPEDIDGLRALAFAQRRHANPETWLLTMRRLADASTAVEMDVWAAVEAFEGLGRWEVVLELIDQHEFELDPWRMTPLRVRTLIELGWQRRALEQLRKAYSDEYIRGHEAVELLIQCEALALAATFIDGAMSTDPWQADARSSIIAIASRSSTAASLQEAPVRFADAAKAQDILMPGSESIEGAMDRARLVLTAGAGQLLANDDAAGAARLLVAAVRLAPADRALLESLAEAAHRANMTERYLDTLLRIWTTHGDASALFATARGILETSTWATILQVIAIAAAEAGPLGLDMGDVVEKFREQAYRRIEDYIRGGDSDAGLELVIGLSPQLCIADWPSELLSRLLRAVKRKLRSQRAGGEALIASVGPLYLQLAPQDVDVCRMMARVLVRQRRLREARELLERVVSNSPHLASDWVALAMAQNELGDYGGRDVSVARALLISPDDNLPPALSPVRAQMGIV